MFTGLIETVGTVVSVTRRGNYRLFGIESSLPMHEIEIGESIACNGPCLTVTEKSGSVFSVDASQETLDKTTLGDLKIGSRLNLERALKVGSRLGGHFVSGHIDDTGMVDSMRPVGQSWELAISFNPDFDPLVVDKGSIAIDGVSLTVNRTRSGWFSVNIIPHTISETALDELKSGRAVNLEFDLIGKYILKMNNTQSAPNITLDKLKESGW